MIRLGRFSKSRSLRETVSRPDQERVSNAFARPIRIQTSDGRIIQGEWNGYYDLRSVGDEAHHSVGYPDDKGGLTHGWLHPGDKILDPVPTVEEWEAEWKKQENQRKSRINDLRDEFSRKPNF